MRAVDGFITITPRIRICGVDGFRILRHIPLPFLILDGVFLVLDWWLWDWAFLVLALFFCGDGWCLSYDLFLELDM